MSHKRPLYIDEYIAKSRGWSLAGWSLAVRATGTDGHVAFVASAEITPQFAGRPIQLADHMDGALIADKVLRLVVPSDRRGG